MNIKSFSLFVTVGLSILGVTSAAQAESNGSWKCTLDGKEWTDSKGGASLNAGNLTLYSSDDRVEGIYIMTLKPAAVGSFALNDGAQAQFSDPSGKNHKSKAGSGTLTFAKYTAPEGDVLGKVEGTFSATFEGDAGKEPALKDCTFSLPVKNL